jgi:hypothetical protein
MARKKNNIIDLQNIDFSNLSFDVDAKTTKEQDEEREQDKIFTKEYFEDFEFNARYIKPKKCFFKTTAIKHDNAKKLAAELPPTPNFRYDVIVSGSFIFGDFIHAYLTKHHLQAKRCIISTLGMNEANVDALAALLRANYIIDLELFVSVYFFSLKRHDIVPYIYRTLDAEEFRGRFQLSVSHIHTKTFQFETPDGRKMIMQGSANLCSPRISNNSSLKKTPKFMTFTPRTSRNSQTSSTQSTKPKTAKNYGI